MSLFRYYPFELLRLFLLYPFCMQLSQFPRDKGASLSSVMSSSGSHNYPARGYMITEQ